MTKSRTLVLSQQSPPKRHINSHILGQPERESKVVVVSIKCIQSN